MEYPQPRPMLAFIDDSQRHKLMLREWRREAKFLERDYDRKLASCSHSRADLATMLGLNFAFQGLLVSGVAPSQIIVCRHWPYVCILSAIASLGTIFATLRKLTEMANNQQRLDVQIKQMTWQNARINELKEQGTDFDLEQISEFNPYTPKGPQQGWVWWSHFGAILALLIAFSVAILVSIQRMLCS